MFRSIAVLAVFFGLAACSSKPPVPQVAKPKPVVQSIAIVPAVAPARYGVRNRNLAVGDLVLYAVGRANSEVLTQKLNATSPTLSASFSEAMANELRGLGYRVVVLHDLKRNPADPEDVDYAPLFERVDAVLHLRFRDVGLESPLFSISYMPRVNARGMLYAKGLDDALYDSTIYYGIDARAGKDWGIVANDPTGFDSFDALVNNIEGVRQTFETGARAISQRMATQMHAAMR